MAPISYKAFLSDVREKSKENVSTNYEYQLAEATSNESGKIDEDLIDSLKRKDAFAVWKYIANAEGEEIKEMKSFSVCQKMIENRKQKKEKSCCGKIRDVWQNVKKINQCQCPTNVERQRQQNAPSSPKEQQDLEGGNEQSWLTILSDPIYVGIKWLWSTNPNNCSRKEDAEDVVVSVLHDSYFLEELAKYEHHYSRDDYLKRALRCENFAAGVVEQGTSRELHQMMDSEGEGPLVCKDNNNTTACKHVNFNASLDLLRIAAEKGRKKFVSSPRCQFILSEIVYEDPCWQDRNTAVKVLWALWQLILVVVLSAVYVPYKLAVLCGKRSCCNEDQKRNHRCSCCCRNWFCCILRKTFEHPYCKLVNHTTWYLAFLILVFGSISERNFGTTTTGLSNYDYCMMAFVTGFVMVEFSELYRQGCFVYFSKWWNVVDILIVATFVLAYAMWLIAWGLHDKEWKPRNAEFIWADVFYATACVMAYFHLAHVFQVNRTLGPLQLSLYKMLKDVLKFLLIFLMLYIAFSTGLTKIYTYYVASQIKLRNQNVTHYDVTHPYERHVETFLGLFWLLIGNLNVRDMDVSDPAFSTTQTFGRIYFIFYIVFMVIVALSMLIAMMNNSFERIMENADMEWKFSRTQMWLEWIDKGNALPSPLSNFLILYFIFCGLCHLYSDCKKKEKGEANNQSVIERSPSQTQLLDLGTAEGRSNDDGKVYKKARIETMQKLVVRYLVEYLEKDSEVKK